MELKKEGLKGVVFYSGIRIFDKLFSLVSVIVLARLLSPEDFGLIALAMTAIVLFQGLSETGFEEALIQGNDITDEHYNVAWTYGRVLRGVALFLLEFLLAHYIAVFYDNVELELVIKVLAINELFRGFTNIGVVKFVKHAEFQSDFVFSVIGRLVRVVSVVIFALILKDVWALVISYLLFNITNLVSSYMLHPFRPRLNFNLVFAKRLFKFGIWITFVQLSNSLRSVADKAILGKLLDAGQLGHYQVSSRIGMELADDVKTIVSKVLFPLLSVTQSNERRMEKFHDILAALLIFVLPMSTFVALNADLLVTLLLGEKWIATIGIVKIMAVVAVLKTINTSIYPVLKAMGHPEQVFQLNMIQLITLLVCIVPLINHFGLEGAVYALIASFVTSMIYWFKLFITYSNGVTLNHNKYGFVLISSLLMYGLLSFERLHITPDIAWLSLLASSAWFLVLMIASFRFIASYSSIETITVLNEKLNGMWSKVYSGRQAAN